MHISAQRPAAMSESTWQRFLRKEGIGVVDYLLGANCNQVSLIEDGRLTRTITRADLIATLRHKPNDKPGYELWLIPPRNVEMLMTVLLSLAHRLAQSLNREVRVPMQSYGFRIDPTETFDRVIDSYWAIGYDLYHG